MKYIEYGPIDFATDESFQSYVYKEHSKDVTFWNKFIKDHPEKSQDINEASRILELIHEFNPDLKKEEYDEEFFKFSRMINVEDFDDPEYIFEKEYPKKSFFQKIDIFWAIIVILLIISASIFFIQLTYKATNQPIESEPASVTKKNPPGQKSTLFLNDGTVIHLNSSSSLSYLEDFSDSVRSVSLVGEAYFSIASDIRPFVVKAQGVEITALETRFNVKAYAEMEHVEVASHTGGLMISYKQRDGYNTTTINSGEQLTFNKFNFLAVINEFDPQRAFGWKEGVLIFEEADMFDFKNILERWYGVQIIFNGSKKDPWKINTIFENESIREVLNKLSVSHDFDFDVSGNIIVIHLK